MGTVGVNVRLMKELSGGEEVEISTGKDDL